MRRKLIAFVIASAIVGSALLATFVWYHGRLHREAPTAWNVHIYSIRGERLASFFDGLPVDRRFSHGRKSFKFAPPPSCQERSAVSSFGVWIRGLLGTTAYAQSETCTGCSCELGRVTK
jgi:hypothetical protein